MLKKIVSGGQTGVDRAALDASLEIDFPCGGWCPKGRLAEDGPLAERYPLKETPSAEYAQRTEWNVRDSDATLILTQGKPTEGTALTIEFTQKHKKPCLVIDFLEEHSPKTALDWIKEKQVKTLNVAGPRESKKPGISSQAKEFLQNVLASS